MHKLYIHSQSQNVNSKKKGITLLLVVVLLSAMLSISLGIFALIYGQISLSAEIRNSSRAFLAADEGAEKVLYLARVLNICETDPPPIECTPTSHITADAGGSCYSATLSKKDLNPPFNGTPDTMVITIIGEYQCQAGNTRAVKRAFELSYPLP